MKMKMITLKSSDNQIFELEEEAASGSQTIRCMIEDECADSAIPLPNVDSKTLAKITEYLKKHADMAAAEHADEAATKKEKEDFDLEFVNVDHDTLFDLIMAANYMNIQSLLDLTCQAVANKMRGKTTEEIRKMFHIVNDFTPEEEEKVRRENAWAFE